MKRSMAVLAISSALAPVSATAGVTRSDFGRTADGKPVHLFTLTNAHGLEARVITYGGILVSLKVPDRQGRLGDVVLGHDDLAAYLASPHYFGCITGRYANRIAGGRFTLDGKTHVLSTNLGPHHLHGGKRGFDKVVWEAGSVSGEDRSGITLSHTSPDGEEGYPGTLRARVSYTLTDQDELVVEYFATTDRPTIVNLTQHTYFNLAGDGARDILAHELQILADRYTPVDAAMIPTGAIAPVEGTPLDFRQPRPIGARIDAKHEQIAHGSGYDHNFVINRRAPGLTLAARLSEPATGRVLEVETSEPGVQFYSANHLQGGPPGKAGRVYGRRYGVCLETQHYPDSPNRPSFPPTVLRPGEEYRSQTLFRFKTAP
jgi:aldose 1-epimerase